MKNYLIGFIVMLISIIPISNVKASEGYEVKATYGGSTFTFMSPEHYGYKYGFYVYENGMYYSKYYFLSNEPLAYSTGYVVVNNYDDISTDYVFANNPSVSTSLSSFSSRSSAYGLNNSRYKIIWSNYDVPEVEGTNPGVSTGNVSHACNASVCVSDFNYEYTIELNPNDYDYIYLKLQGGSDTFIDFEHDITNGQSLFYDLYKNDVKMDTFYVYNGVNLSLLVPYSINPKELKPKVNISSSSNS